MAVSFFGSGALVRAFGAFPVFVRSIVFGDPAHQQLEIDCVIGERHREGGNSCLDHSGPTAAPAVVLIPGVARR
ncbi:hypothetical protein ACJRO7_034679, partial [Eucalyptus globulus]